MASWISEEGVFFPANERVSMMNETDEEIDNPSIEGSQYYGMKVPPRSPYVYEGPCRDALKVLHDLGLEEQGYMGDHFSQNEKMRDLAREFNCKDVAEYVKKTTNYNSDRAKEIVAEYKKKSITHGPLHKVANVRPSGGGTNTTGKGNDMEGAIGTPPNM
jgi:hypothetical protein